MQLYIDLGVGDFLVLIGIGEIATAILFVVPLTMPLGLLLQSSYWGGAPDRSSLFSDLGRPSDRRLLIDPGLDGSAHATTPDGRPRAAVPGLFRATRVSSSP